MFRVAGYTNEQQIRSSAYNFTLLSGNITGDRKWKTMTLKMLKSDFRTFRGRGIWTGVLYTFHCSPWFTIPVNRNRNKFGRIHTSPELRHTHWLPSWRSHRHGSDVLLEPVLSASGVFLFALKPFRPVSCRLLQEMSALLWLLQGSHKGTEIKKMNTVH